jgi:hypothetical protein
MIVKQPDGLIAMTKPKITEADLQAHLTNRLFKGRLSMVVHLDEGSVSIQASKGHYSSPKDNLGPYTKVEVLLSDDAKPGPRSWRPFAAGFDKRHFGYLPVHLLIPVLNRRGAVLPDAQEAAQTV